MPVNRLPPPESSDILGSDHISLRPIGAPTVFEVLLLMLMGGGAGLAS
jgi:hypothetical protein